MERDPVKLEQELRREIKGDVSFSDQMRGIYATDASIYQILPVGVVLPRDDEDVIHAVRIAAEHGIPVLPRGSGTSLNGQATGPCLVIDFTKHMNRVLEFNLQERWVRVQPGVVLDELNEFLKKFNLHFAPDPATSNRATIGGMIGNNSSGSKSVIYGITKDHVLETRTLLSDGSILNFKEFRINAPGTGIGRSAMTEDGKPPVPGHPGEKGQILSRRGTEIMEGFTQIIEKNRDAIKEAYPGIMRRVQGYNLDAFIDKESWNFSDLLTGSEGTLGIILGAKLKLMPLPKHKILCTVHFNDLLDCIRNVAPMLEHSPSAVEILDEDLINTARSSHTIAPLCDWIEGNPKGILIVEFFGDSVTEVRAKAEKLAGDLRGRKIGYAWPILEDSDAQARVWAVRKNGLGIMMRIEGEAKPIGFIEDAAIPLEFLPEYIENILKYCRDLDVKVIMYAHASVGLIHVRPVLNLKMQEDIEKMKSIAGRSFELVKLYNGSISGEHGDGRIRSPFLEGFFGREVYQAFREVKNLFDPSGILNPGIIVDPAPMDADLRYGTDYSSPRLETVYNYREQGNFAAAVETCSGVGVCRQNLGGLMCPSYRATRDEEHSTRGRANALRMTMTGQLDKADFSDPELFRIMDLCLSCKGCKSECPTNVDVARLKSEYLNIHHRENGIALRDRFVSMSTNLARVFSGWKAPIINAVQRTTAFRKILEWTVGIDSRRILPAYAPVRFHRWYHRRHNRDKPGNPSQSDGTNEARTHQALEKSDIIRPAVVLFDDTYMNYHQVDVGISAVELLESCGYDVILAKAGCCQRPGISHGFLDKAKREGEKTLRNLNKYIDEGLKIVVCEPGCASALTDDLPDLIDDRELGDRIKKNVLMIDLFLENELREGKIDVSFTSAFKKLVVHGHCHQKSLYGTSAMERILNTIPDLDVEVLDSGCCGMAGSFGYEKEHFELSMKVGEDRLFPAIRNMEGDAQLVACGFSCRHQISDATGMKAKHWVEVLRGRLKA